MPIALDEQIQFGIEAFRAIGEVKALPASRLTPSNLAGADMLVVRSVTRVDRKLLEGSHIRFVGSVTSGIDHIDLDYLQKEGIAFAHAPGCNATSVAEYIVAALAVLEGRLLPTKGKMLGVVGVGHVGSLVSQKASALGWKVFRNDPPLAPRQDLLPLDALMDCDVITLHVPLIEQGPFRTRQLFDAARLRKMKKGSILINSSRGEVLDEAALISCLRDGHLSGAVIDVWANEPNINTALLEHSTLATPHIAGYSIEGRAAGTEAVYAAACRHLGITGAWRPRLPTPESPLIDSGSLIGAIKHAYDISADDARMRGLLAVPEPDRAGYFGKLRKEYPSRREFASFRVRGSAQLLALGFGRNETCGLSSTPALESAR